MEHINCNICGSSSHSPLFELSDFHFGRKDHHTSLVVCSQCGLVYQTPRPTLLEMRIHYPSDYEPFAAQTVSKSVSIFSRMLLQYGVNKKRNLITSYKHSGRLLEVGCGSGEFLKAMSEVPDWETYGIESNPNAAQNASSRFNLKILNGTLNEANFSSSFFDAAAMWDVLEHLHNPRESLDEIYRVLKPDGILFLRVPNLDSLDAKIFEKYWSGLDAPRHLYVFNRKTLTRILNQAGFCIEKMSCKSGSYASFLYSVRFWLIGSGKMPTLSQKIISLLSNPFTRLIMSPYFIGIGFSSWGPELTSIAFKQKE